MFKVDLHVHYKRHARDSQGYEEDMVQAAKNVGLDAIGFTEHRQMLPPERIAELAAKYGIKIYSGAEVNCPEGDFLVYDTPDIDLKRPWTYGELEQASACLILAHPGRKDRPFPKACESCPPVGVEIASRNTPVAACAALARWIIKDLDPTVPLINSDAHKPRHLGAHYNLAEALPNKVSELVISCISGDWPPHACS